MTFLSRCRNSGVIRLFDIRISSILLLDPGKKVRFRNRILNFDLLHSLTPFPISIAWCACAWSWDIQVFTLLNHTHNPEVLFLHLPDSNTHTSTMTTTNSQEDPSSTTTTTTTKEQWDQLCQDVKAGLLEETGSESWYLIIVSYRC